MKNQSIKSTPREKSVLAIWVYK